MEVIGRIHVTRGMFKKPSSKAAASEEAKRTLSRTLRPLSDARTKLEDFSTSR